MELTLQEKRKLINFFEFLLDEEVSKPLGEMNDSAVDNYIKILLHLQDKRVELSPEFIDEQVRKILNPEETAAPETAKTTNKTNKKQINKKKVWLVAACIAILVALFSIVSVANDWNVFDFLSEKFGSVFSVPIEEKQEYNGITITNHGKNTNYKTVEEALKTEEIDVLYPSSLPKTFEIEEIICYKSKNSHRMSYIFNDLSISFVISLNSDIDNYIQSVTTGTIKINGYKCYICEIPDTHCTQIYFEHKGNRYMLSHTDKEVLIEIIENLEEIKNEN